MTLLPRSLAGQTVLLLLIGLTASHLASMATFSHDREGSLEALSSRSIAGRIAEIVHLVEGSPHDWRPVLLQAANAPGLQVAGTAAPMSRPAPETGEESIIRGYMEGLTGRTAVVRLVDPDDASRHEHPGLTPQSLPDGHIIEADVQLADGSWLRFSAVVPRIASIWSIEALVSMALMTAGVLVASFWAARRLTRPLATFAEAAVRLGKDVGAPPLPISGPTELRRAQEAFNEMQERLRRLIENRLQMVAAISHDLKTPITLLRLHAEFIEDEDGRNRMLAILDEMETLVRSTLSFAREEAIQEPRRVVDVAALIRSVCDDIGDAGADVQCEAPARLPVECRPLALKRAFQNIIENAVKYGHRARVAITGGRQILVTVDDDGPGIPEDEMARVFMPFYRLEHSRCRDTGGVGLGLAVTQSIINAHGGNIQMENRRGGGLRVTVELPA